MLMAAAGSQSSTVSVPEPTAPTITSSASVLAGDGNTLSHALTADESVTWAVTGGADAGDVEISGSTLRWLSNGTQSVGSPADADTDNVYEVEVTATSVASGLTATQDIEITVSDAWVTVYDATTGAFGADLDQSFTNTRTLIYNTSLLMGSSGYTKIRVTFRAAASADMVIENAAFGKSQGDTTNNLYVNYSGSPTTLLFSASAGATVPAGTTLVSDMATLATAFDITDSLIIAINHGLSSYTGRTETDASHAVASIAGDDSTNPSINASGGPYFIGGFGTSWGVEKIELRP